MVYSNDIQKCCKYCCDAVELVNSDEMLCTKNGPVSADYYCKKYRYDAIKRRPIKKAPLREFSESDFTIESEA